MKPDYSLLDQPEALAVIFHPRSELTAPPSLEGVSDHLIPVATDVSVGARFFAPHAAGANLLFFHGNGEIAADYDELGPLFNSMGINFMAADYRGYGRSNGHPTVSHMMADCHIVLDYLLDWCKQNGLTGSIIVMGRSLGSASALELAAARKDQINGLIIESGFAYAADLLRVLGVDPDQLGLSEDTGFLNLFKIAQYQGPTLIIHAEFDHIIPYTDAEALFEQSTSTGKHLLCIDGANHNDILMRGFQPYMQALRDLVEAIQARRK